MKDHNKYDEQLRKLMGALEETPPPGMQERIVRNVLAAQPARSLQRERRTERRMLIIVSAVTLVLVIAAFYILDKYEILDIGAMFASMRGMFAGIKAPVTGYAPYVLLAIPVLLLLFADSLFRRHYNLKKLRQDATE